MPTTLPVRPAGAQCRYCGAALDALAQRRGAETCGAARCRQRTDAARVAQLRQSFADVALQAGTRLLSEAAPRAADADKGSPSPPTQVVWLQPMQRRLVDVTDADRASQRAYLESLEASETHIDHAALGGWQARPSQSPQGRQLCGQCGGHCCLHGLPGHAFVDAALLQRWVGAHAGSSMADAIASYLDRLPVQHVENSCLYQGAAGCHLPRDERSEICNNFACDALRAAEQLAGDDPASTVVAVTMQRSDVLRAALIERDAAHALPLPSPSPSPSLLVPAAALPPER